MEAGQKGNFTKFLFLWVPNYSISQESQKRSLQVVFFFSINRDTASWNNIGSSANFHVVTFSSTTLAQLQAGRRALRYPDSQPQSQGVWRREAIKMAVYTHITKRLLYYFHCWEQEWARIIHYRIESWFKILFWWFVICIQIIFKSGKWFVICDLNHYLISRILLESFSNHLWITQKIRIS